MMTLIEGYKARYSSALEEEMSLEEYLQLCRKDPDAYASAHERMLTAIGERQKQLAEEILSRWNTNDGMLARLSKFPNQRYADSHEAIADLLRVQVTALAHNYPTAKQLIPLIIDACPSQRGTINGVFVQSITFEFMHPDLDDESVADYVIPSAGCDFIVRWEFTPS